MIGYDSLDEMINLPIDELVAPRSQKLIIDNIAKNISIPFESFFLRKNGNEFPGLACATQTKFNSKNVNVLSIVDITQFYYSKKQLEVNETHYKSIFNNIPITVWEEDASELLTYTKELGLEKIEDLQSYLESNPKIISQAISRLKIINVNATALKLFGVKDKGAVENMDEFFTEVSLNRFIKPMSAIIKNQTSFEMESEFINAKGKIIDIHIYWKVIPGYERDYSRIINVITDISLRKRAEIEKQRMESSIAQMQKLESLGVFADGIASDFNNLLVRILNNVNLTLNQIDPNSPIIDLLKEIQETGKQASNLTKQLQVYSGHSKISKKLFNLNDLIEEMQAFIGLTIPEKVGISNYLSNTDPWIVADRAQISQLIINLLMNASESMKDGGIITVKTFHITKESLDNYSGSMVLQPIESTYYTCLEINDFGIGIEESTVSKIFDPFYSNKFKRSGLGLSVVLGIVKQHEGGLIVETKISEGTSFKILFPLSLDYKTVQSYQKVEEKAPTNVSGGKILIVDDESSVISAASMFLKAIGFESVVASDGYQAIKAYQENSDIKLVVLDLIMEKISGQQTFIELRKINPHLPIIISSGYLKDQTYSAFEREKSIGFLQKPYSSEELKNAILALL